MDKNQEYLSEIVEILQSLKVQLPDDRDKIADGLELTDIMKKKSTLSVKEVLKYFRAYNRDFCSYRHQMIKKEESQWKNIMLGDKLKLLIFFFLCI